MVITKDELIVEIRSLGSDDLGVFGGEYEGGIWLQQSAEELAGLVEWLRDKGCRSYLEVGVAAGGLCYVLNKYLGFDEICLVDDNEHKRAGERVRVLWGVNRREVIGRSPEVVGEFDLVFLDGGHRYVEVRGDVEKYGKNVKKGGYLVLHDVNLGWGPGEVAGELGSEWKHCVDFIDKERLLGIGVYKKL